jgi:hypothetical protein
MSFFGKKKRQLLRKEERTKVEHHRGLGPDLDKLYQSIKQVIEDEKNLRIVSEYKGTLNDIPQSTTYHMYHISLLSRSGRKY